METISQKFCPSCKLINRVDAIICEHCGNPFDSPSDKFSTTKGVEGETKLFHTDLLEKIEKLTKESPPEGIAIYLLDQANPIETRLDDEFIIGRLTGEKEDKVVDLSPYNANDLGVSRRHLMVRRAGKGYNVVDLFSTNGTWVNELTLLPQHPFAVKSGSQIRLGKMRIFLAFRE
jgi:hypothetical protein